MKINNLQIENVKRVKAVRIEPTKSGLTVVGGKNNQGKTSILDAIAWALGGNKFRPTSAQREDSVLPLTIKVVMDNGLVVERKGKNSDLKVTDPSGNKAGQALLDSFVEELALNLPKFMEANSKEKAETLLKIIGVGDQLFELEQKEAEVYNKRHAIGQIADQKEKFAKEQPYYPDAPDDLVSVTELIQRQQAILAQNGENQRKRNLRDQYDRELVEAQTAFEEAKKRLEQAKKDADTARKSAEDLQDESTAEIEDSINSIEQTNVKVRANLDKQKAEDDAAEYRNQYDLLTAQIQEIREAKSNLLNTASLPLAELSVEDRELVYKGHNWDSMSGSDQLKVATAIVRKLKPNCQFVLMDKLEQMDLETLEEFGKWAESEGLQVIATRVSTGEECTLIIEDGYVKGQEMPITEEKTWEAGKF